MWQEGGGKKARASVADGCSGASGRFRALQGAMRLFEALRRLFRTRAVQSCLRGEGVKGV